MSTLTHPSSWEKRLWVIIVKQKIWSLNIKPTAKIDITLVKYSTDLKKKKKTYLLLVCLLAFERHLPSSFFISSDFFISPFLTPLKKLPTCPGCIPSERVLLRDYEILSYSPSKEQLATRVCPSLHIRSYASQNGGVPTLGENTLSDRTNVRVNARDCWHFDGFIFLAAGSLSSRA